MRREKKREEERKLVKREERSEERGEEKRGEKRRGPTLLRPPPALPLTWIPVGLISRPDASSHTNGSA